MKRGLSRVYVHIKTKEPCQKSHVQRAMSTEPCHKSIVKKKSCQKRHVNEAYITRGLPRVCVCAMSKELCYNRNVKRAVLKEAYRAPKEPCQKSHVKIATSKELCQKSHVTHMNQPYHTCE